MELGKFLAATRCICLAGVPAIGRVARYSLKEAVCLTFGEQEVLR